MSTTVVNLADSRTEVLPYPANVAVVAAYELYEMGNSDLSSFDDHPDLHPQFREHQLGFSCGDWIAYKQKC